MQYPKKKRKRGKILLGTIITLLLLTLVVTLWINNMLSKVNRVDIDEDALAESKNEFVDDNIEGYWNIAIFGVDSRTNDLLKNTRSDSIIIASMDKKTKDVKLVSVYRDTFADIDGVGYAKINAAYASGGPQLAISTLNRMLDLDIEDFVTVNFSAVTQLVNLIDGVEITIEEDEIDALNKNIKDCNKLNKTKSPLIKKAGVYTLDGTQALAYSRIRKTSGSDYRRTQRQRTVLMSVLKKAKSSSLTTLNSIIDTMLPQIATDLTTSDILSLTMDVFSCDIVEDSGFPFDKKGANIKGASVVVADDLEQNVIKLHQMLFTSEEYTPSATVKKISKDIKAKTR